MFRRYFYRLCEYTSRFRLAYGMVEEVVSDVFINLWLRRNELTIKQIRGYLFAAAKNTALNYLKAVKPALTFDEIDDNRLVSDCSTDVELNIKDLEVEINQYTERLPPQQRKIFRLSKIEGFKTGEIAEILSLSPKTVNNHLIEASRFIFQHYKKEVLKPKGGDCCNYS